MAESKEIGDFLEAIKSEFSQWILTHSESERAEIIESLSAFLRRTSSWTVENYKAISVADVHVTELIDSINVNDILNYINTSTPFTSSELNTFLSSIVIKYDFGEELSEKLTDYINVNTNGIPTENFVYDLLSYLQIPLSSPIKVTTRYSSNIRYPWPKIKRYHKLYDSDCYGIVASNNKSVPIEPYGTDNESFTFPEGIHHLPDITLFTLQNLMTLKKDEEISSIVYIWKTPLEDGDVDEVDEYNNSYIKLQKYMKKQEIYLKNYFNFKVKFSKSRFSKNSDTSTSQETNTNTSKSKKEKTEEKKKKRHNVSQLGKNDSTHQTYRASTYVTDYLLPALKGGQVSTTPLTAEILQETSKGHQRASGLTYIPKKIVKKIKPNKVSDLRVLSERTVFFDTSGYVMFPKQRIYTTATYNMYLKRILLGAMDNNIFYNLNDYQEKKASFSKEHKALEDSKTKTRRANINNFAIYALLSRGPDFMGNDFMGMFTLEASGEKITEFSTISNVHKWKSSTNNSKVDLPDDYNNILNSFYMRIEDVTVPSIATDSYPIDFCGMKVRKLQSSFSESHTISISMPLDDKGLLLQRFNVLAGKLPEFANEEDNETAYKLIDIDTGKYGKYFPNTYFPMSFFNNPEKRRLDFMLIYNDYRFYKGGNPTPTSNTGGKNNFQKLILAPSEPSSNKENKPADVTRSMSTGQVWGSMNSYRGFIFEDVKILGNTNGLSFNRDSAGKMNLSVTLLFKRITTIDTNLLNSTPANNSSSKSTS